MSSVRRIVDLAGIPEEEGWAELHMTTESARRSTTMQESYHDLPFRRNVQEAEGSHGVQSVP